MLNFCDLILVYVFTTNHHLINGQLHLCSYTHKAFEMCKPGKTAWFTNFCILVHTIDDYFNDMANTHKEFSPAVINHTMLSALI